LADILTDITDLLFSPVALLWILAGVFGWYLGKKLMKAENVSAGITLIFMVFFMSLLIAGMWINPQIVDKNIISVMVAMFISTSFGGFILIWLLSFLISLIMSRRKSITVGT